MQQFTESGLIFSFDPDWRVYKYDEHRFYQGFSGVGLKGVDFIALQPGRSVVLVEVKNLRQYPRASPWSELADSLIESVAPKVEDTLRGVAAIGQYYRRKWWRPLLIGLPRWASWRNSEWRYWDDVANCADRPEQLSVILWLESEKPPPGWRTDLHRRLRQRLRPVAGNVLITNTEAFNPRNAPPIRSVKKNR